MIITKYFLYFIYEIYIKYFLGMRWHNKYSNTKMGQKGRAKFFAFIMKGYILLVTRLNW